MSLQKVCEELVRQGLATPVYGGAIRLNCSNSPEVQRNLVAVEERYAARFDQLLVGEQARQREAWKKLRDFVFCSPA